MTRIFLTLAWFAVLLVTANLIVGLALGDLYNNPPPETLAWARLHRLLGVAAAMAVVLVESIVVTYFIGTSRWCKEVVETYGLDRQFVKQASAIKRRAFPWALLSMLVAVGILALGGAADPATGRPDTKEWVTPHLVAALGGLCFIGWAAVQEWQHIHDNYRLIAGVMAEVKRIRSERGLDV